MASARRTARSMAELPNLPGYRPHQVMCVGRHCGLTACQQCDEADADEETMM